MNGMPTRLGKGKAIQGPEFYGCSNTGHAPVILHSAELVAYDIKGKRFAVGDALYVDDAVYEYLLGKVSGNTWKRGHLATVKFFKTYKAAREYFKARCEEILKRSESMQKAN